MSALSISLDGLKRIEVTLTTTIDSLDVGALLDQSAALLLHRTLQRFQTMVDPDGKPWAPLKPATRARKQNRFGGGNTLYASGKLYRSLQVFKDGANGRKIGTDVPYAVFHHTGTLRMPKRAFLGINEADTGLVQAAILKKVQEALS